MSAPKRTSLQQFFDYCLQNSLPVALYRLPGSHAIKVVAQKHSTLLTAPEAQSLSLQKGFIFAPFHEDKTYSKVIIIPDIFTTADKLPDLNFAGKPAASENTEVQKEKIKEASRANYFAYVKSIQQEIKKGKFEKVVAARVVKKKKPGHFNCLIFFSDLCKKYPTAFTSLVYTPKYGLWIGATPEILLNVDHEGAKTYSLAGTKQNGENNLNSDWGEKEQQEQKIVSDYILRAFKKVTKSKPQIQGPETIKAGNLLHLRTTFTYKNIAKDKWPALVKHLHPTPAVAGLPKTESVDFINAREMAARSFYSGYLGPVNLDKEINLFVNLRCMKVLKNKLVVYVGCGITADSKPAAEWKESKMKSETLLSVLTEAKNSAGKGFY